MLLQLIDNEGRQMCGSDGVMNYDKRHNLENIKNEVRERNKRFEKNFPHKIATAFQFWASNRSDRYSESSYSEIHKL